MAHCCAAATGPPGRSAWSVIPPPLTGAGLPANLRSRWLPQSAVESNRFDSLTILCSNISEINVPNIQPDQPNWEGRLAQGKIRKRRRQQRVRVDHPDENVGVMIASSRFPLARPTAACISVYWRPQTPLGGKLQDKFEFKTLASPSANRPTSAAPVWQNDQFETIR